MTKYTKTQVTQLSANESAALQQINKNLDDIQAAIQDTVSRSGQSPTQMTADLDMNGKRLINVPAPLTDNDLVRRKDVVEDIVTVQSLVNTASTAAGQAIAAAEGVQEAIADAHVGIVADDLMLGDDSKIRIAANNIDDISACVSDIESIKDVGENISNVNAVADNETNINAVNSNKTNIDAVAGNATNINTVAGVSSDVTTVAGISSNVSSVASNVTNINTCASNMSSITGASTQAANAAASAQAASSSAEQAAISAAGTRFKLFHHDWFDYQLNDLAWLRADTFSWQDGTVYSDAYNHLVDDATNGTSQTETIAGHTITYTLAADGHKIVSDANASAVEGLYTDTGVAWYYVLDTANQRFKFPRTKYGFTGLRDTVGKYVPESLPNIKGKVYARGIGDGADVLGWDSGCIQRDFSDKVYTGNVTGTGGTEPAIAYKINASLSSSVYQDNAPVQQRATQMYLYFYVGQFSQTATEQTAGLNSELFNGKVDLNAANLSTQGKSLISSLGMPSNRYNDLTLGADQTQYTAPANGYYSWQASSTVTNQYFGMVNYSSGIQSIQWTPISGGGCHGFLPVKKGDIVTVVYTATSVSTFRFVYAEGEQ